MTASGTAPAPLVRFEGVTKRFGSLVANSDVSFDVQAGEVLALLGENGAGKSTLMKCLFGVHPPDAGRILLDGRPSPIRSPADALAARVGMVFQRFSLIGALTVRDNLLLNWPRTPFFIGRRSRRAARVLDVLATMAPHLDPDRRVDTLSAGEQQLVELVKVLNLDARLVVLDEPSSVLTPVEVERLHGFVRTLASQGIAVVFITHKMADVQACADRIVILRRGRVVDVSVRGERTIAQIVERMMGGAVGTPERAAPDAAIGAPRLVVDGLRASHDGMRLRDVCLEVRAGEILGIAGVAGNGQELLAEAIAGVVPVEAGDVLLDGLSIARRDERASLCTPLGYVPHLARDNAVVLSLDVAANLHLRDIGSPAYGGRPVEAADSALLDTFDVVPRDPGARVDQLSGGNVQKLVIAREFGRPRPALLACYPTMGLDVAATERVYAAMSAQAGQGAAVLWISEELDDLLARAHRIAVMTDGRLSTPLHNGPSLTRERLGRLMTDAGGDAAAAIGPLDEQPAAAELHR